MSAIAPSGGGGTTILANTEALPQAAYAWADLQPRMGPYMSNPFYEFLVNTYDGGDGVEMSITPNTEDVATQAALSATVDWGWIYDMRVAQRDELAHKLVFVICTDTEIIAVSDQTNASNISSVTPSPAGPTLA